MESANSVVLNGQIEQAFKDMNKKNYYQVFLIIFMSFLSVLEAFMVMVGPFVFMNPIFSCQGEIVPEVDACNNLINCTITNNYTATFYAGLYCQNEFIRSTIQSSFYLGCVIGMFFLVPLSDSRGRRFVTMFALSSCFFGNCIIIIGIYLKIWALMMLGNFFNGLYVAFVTSISYIMTGQFTDDKTRQKSIMVYCAMWGLGEMLFLPIYYFLAEWDKFLIFALLIPSIGSLLIGYFFILETPYFCLYLANNYQIFRKNIQMLSAYNKSDSENVQKVLTLSKKYLQQISKTQQSPHKNTLLSSIKQLIKKQNLITCISISLILSVFSIYYFSMQGSMQRTGYNFGISMFLAGLHQFIGYLLVSIIAHRIPRKKGLLITNIIASGIGLAFMIPFIKSNQLLQTIFISLARLSTVFSNSFLTFFQTQSFSPQIKSTAFGVTEGFSQIAEFFVPFLIIKMNDMNIHPIIFSSILYLVFGTIPLIFLKQRLNPTKSQDEQQQSKKKTLLDTEYNN